MSARLTILGLVLAAVDLAWAVFLVVQICSGAAASWLTWLVPLPLAAALYILAVVVRRHQRERA